MPKQLLRPFLLLITLALGSSTLPTTAQAPILVSDADNQELANSIGVLGGAHLGAVVGSFSPETISATLSEIVAFATNIGLKYLPPVLIAPDSKEITLGANSCSFDFVMPQARYKYSNYLGLLDTSPLPSNWGELGDTEAGHPFVTHVNTDVVVSATTTNPNIIPPITEIARGGPFTGSPVSVFASFPEGRHAVQWTAEARLDPVMDIAFPIVLAGFGAKARYASSGTEATGDAAKVLSKTAKVRKFGLGLFEKLGEETRDFIIGETLDRIEGVDILEGIPSATHQRTQIVTVYDTKDPVLELSQNQFVVEARSFGGAARDEFWEDVVAPSITAYDPCGREVNLRDTAPRFLPVGQTTVELIVSDLGPNLDGEPNSVSQLLTIDVRDTQAPLIVPPASRIVEVAPGTAGLDPAALMLGRPQVVDLADAAPVVTNNGPSFYETDRRASVLWSAQDTSGNTATATQFVTVKTAGTNTAPTAENVSATTLTSQPVDIVLRGNDADFLDGSFDPVSISIETPPANGEFVAPLLPYFIDDYRTNPAGPYGDDFRLGTGFGGNRFQWMSANVCENDTGNPVPGLQPKRFDLTWVYEPTFVKVLDDGTYFLIDKYWECNGDRARTEERISKWNKEGEWIGQIDYAGNFNHFVLDDDGFLYQLSRETGSRQELRVTQCRTAFEEPNGGYCPRRWLFDFASVPTGEGPRLFVERLAYARVDNKEGLIFLSDSERLFVFDVRDTPAGQPGSPFRTTRPEYLGALLEGSRVLGVDRDASGVSCGTGRDSFTLDLDSARNLYAIDKCDNRIHKFGRSYVNADNTFVAGDYVGWLGYCNGSTNNACDVENNRSKGYSCTNDTCSVISGAQTTGNLPGQFAGLNHLAVGPKDILYVVDAGNSRIQRFGADGSFAGEAVSSGTGVNQGERPGFVLGNFGTPRTVSVNSKNFLVIDSDQELVHVFETSPFKDITTNSATLTYVSRFDYPGTTGTETDSFIFIANDGLASSAPATASITVSRNFRAPSADAQQLLTVEDTPLELVLTGDDPDGILGEDFNGLDTLSYRIVQQPRFGQLSGSGADQTYAPDANFSGEDHFLFVASDGREDSEPARVDIEVSEVNDAPLLLDLGLPEVWGRGFPIMLNARLFNDGGAGYDTQVSWGDGTVTPRGDIVEDDEGSRLTGVKLYEPYEGRGEGRAIAEHTYLANGNRTVEWCVSEDGLPQSCLNEVVRIEPLVMLNMELLPVGDELDQGDSATIAVQLTNRAPEGWSGLPATDVRVQQLANSELEVISTSGAPAGCAVEDGALDCRLAGMAPGQTIAFTIDARFPGPIYFDALANIAFSMSNLTPAVVSEVQSNALIRFAADLTDNDNDGLSDPWEVAFGLNPDVDDAAADNDGDGLSNAEEFANRTRPDRADSDNDGFDDAIELANNTDPNTPADSDGDGQTNDLDADDDNDGMSDAFERDNALEPLFAGDALADADGDGVSNLAEARAGTDPQNASDMPAGSSAQPTLYSSILPLSRATPLNGRVSAFATILNTGDTATGCYMVPRTPVGAEYSWQRTDPATNAPLGQRNELASIEAGTAQSFLFSFVPVEELDVDVAFLFDCENTEPAETLLGINTFRLQGTLLPTADVLAMSGTINNNGIVDISEGIGAFSVATFNVGVTDVITVRAKTTGDPGVQVVLCETNPITAECINPGVPAPEATVFFDQAATPTFSVFPLAAGTLPLDPAKNRVVVEFVDERGVVRGSTSVAFRSQP